MPPSKKAILPGQKSLLSFFKGPNPKPEAPAVADVKVKEAVAEPFVEEVVEVRHLRLLCTFLSQ